MQRSLLREKVSPCSEKVKPDHRREQQPSSQRIGVAAPGCCTRHGAKYVPEMRSELGATVEGREWSFGELLTHGVNKPADADEVSSGERLLQGGRNVSGSVQCVRVLTAADAAKQ
jgi:hypothetical protein